MKYDETYKGYRISYQRGNRFAWIWPPSGNLAINHIPTAEPGESLADLKRKTYAAIDADIAEFEASKSK